MADIRPSKIEVRSKRSTDVLINEVFVKSTEALCSTFEIEDNEKSKWTNTFKKVYESSFHQCVKVDGQDWNNVHDETSEFEPVDLEKKEFINIELTNQLFTAVQDLAQKRRSVPPRCRLNLSRQTANDLCRFGQLKVVCKPRTDPLPTVDNVLSSEEVIERLQSTETSLSTLTKKSRREILKAENLKTLTEMSKTNKKTCELTTPSKLTQKQSVSQKKLRFSPRHHSARKPRTRLKLSH